MVQAMIGEEPHDGDTTNTNTTNTTDEMIVSWDSGDAAAPAPPGRDGVPVPEAAAATGSLLLPDPAYGPPATRRRPVVYAQERKRREKINRHLIHLAAVIPGLKKMDKATILSAATRYVKELQEKVKAIEDGGGGGGGNERSVVGSWDSSGTSSSPATNPLPQIEAQILNRDVMVTVHCAAGKGVAVRVLSELEELHLSIVHACVEPFQACTRIMTITAKVDEGFIVSAEDIVGRLKSAALMHQQSRSNSSEETA